MGTNYYVRIRDCGGPCAHCSDTGQLVHLGKSSIGWKFAFQADPEWERDSAIENWLELAQSGEIENEYGDFVELKDLLILIMVKQGGRSHNVDHGPDITGPYFDMFKDSHFEDRGFDFSDREFS